MFLEIDSSRLLVLWEKVCDTFVQYLYLLMQYKYNNFTCNIEGQRTAKLSRPSCDKCKTVKQFGSSVCLQYITSKRWLSNWTLNADKSAQDLTNRYVWPPRPPGRLENVYSHTMATTDDALMRPIEENCWYLGNFSKPLTTLFLFRCYQCTAIDGSQF